MEGIAKALIKAQSEMSNPTKGSANPFFKSKYADLNAVREAVIPTLNTNGIVVLQPIVHIEGKNFVKTILLHESGETIESFTEIIYSKTNDAQAQGSGITYARRYGLQSLVCIGADDDDGNKASGLTDKETPAKTLKKETPPKGNNAPAPTENDDLLGALQEVKAAQSRESLSQIWNNYKAQFGTNEEFRMAVANHPYNKKK